MEHTQDVIKIGDAEIPVVKDGGEIYYPITYIDKNVLMKNKGHTKAKISNKDIQQFNINFSEGNMQQTNCVSKSVLTDAIRRSKTQRLSKEDRIRQNALRKHLGIPEVETKEYDFIKYKLKWCKNYDVLTRISIEENIKNNKECKARRCHECDKIFPLNEGFFVFSKGSFERRCLECRASSYSSYNKETVQYKTGNEYIDYLFKSNGTTRTKKRILASAYTKKDYFELHKSYQKGEIKRMPEDFYTKEWYLEIVAALVNSEKVTTKNLTLSNIKKITGLYHFKFDIQLIDVYKYLYGGDFLYEIWKYPKFSFRDIELTLDIVKANFDNYLKEFNLKIEDPINFDYDAVIRNCGLKSIYDKVGGICGFFVNYWNGKYSGYQFKHIGNYYRYNDKNVERDLKFLIERDLKLQIEKIPLYITKSLLFRQAKSLHHYIVIQKNGSIFEWIDRIYPNRFIEADFTIGNYRNEFDSVEEQQVDDVIREYFRNVVYNFNTSNQVVELFDKRPDWFIFTESGIWLVEYFGMYRPKQRYNSIVNSYMIDTEKKKELYKRLKGYNFLFVYPTDLENDFKGLRDKLEEIQRKTL